MRSAPLGVEERPGGRRRGPRRPRRIPPRARPADRGARRGRRPIRSDPPGARGGVVCPNLPQRPGSRRSTGGESLIFRASSPDRSRPGAPLWQIWTRPRPGPPQEPHPHHPAPAHPHHRSNPGPGTAVPGEKGSVSPGDTPEPVRITRSPSAPFPHGPAPSSSGPAAPRTRRTPPPSPMRSRRAPSPGWGDPAALDARRSPRPAPPVTGRRIGSGLGRCTRRPTTRVGSIAP